MLVCGNQIRLTGPERETFDILTLDYRENKGYPKTIKEYNEALDRAIEGYSKINIDECKFLIRVIEGQKIKDSLF